MNTLSSVVNKQKYELKVNNNDVRILPLSPDAYRKLTKLIEDLKANFRTYQLKQERFFPNLNEPKWNKTWTPKIW